MPENQFILWISGNCIVSQIKRRREEKNANNMSGIQLKNESN